jgi:hypothetical protein
MERLRKNLKLLQIVSFVFFSCWKKFQVTKCKFNLVRASFSLIQNMCTFFIETFKKNMKFSGNDCCVVLKQYTESEMSNWKLNLVGG